MDRIDRLTKKVKQGGKNAQTKIDIAFIEQQADRTWDLDIQMENSKQGYFTLSSNHPSEEAANAELDRVIEEYQINQPEIHVLTDDGLAAGFYD